MILVGKNDPYFRKHPYTPAKFNMEPQNDGFQ